MRILFLDDNKDRHAEFRRQSIGCVVDFVFDATSAIEKMESDKYDVIFLDHDLGGPASENKIIEGAEDGFFVCKWIAENPDLYSETTIIIHSLSQFGPLRMLEILAQAGIYSVIYMKEAWRVFEKVSNDEFVLRRRLE